MTEVRRPVFGRSEMLAVAPATVLPPGRSVDPLAPTVFHQPWWLDIVTDRQWEAIETTENGKVVGRMPICLTRRLGFQTIGMPPLTHFLGPAVDDGCGAPPTRWLRRVAITRALISQLPKAIRLWVKCHRGVTDVVPFQAELYNNQVQFTFEVAPAPEQVLWMAMRDKTRNVIRKAQKRFAVEELSDSAEFTHCYLSNLQRVGRTDWNGQARMEALLAACVSRGAGTMLGVRSETKELVAAVFCSHDATASYYTLSTRRPEAENGAIPLLIWESMRRAARDGLIFDFDGLSTESTIGMYAGFGGVVSPRYVVYSTIPSRALRRGRRITRLNTSTFGS